ncbi:M20 metallopeptidase family protein [Aquimarina megaterium]|uniref:M20 metallopeptidase family protein n=1 Tax=Aquimarina megaterium TaxID=1443666 RepID=UPI000941DE4B|nr:amidohydrolase [Aquimarina megaterium]
MKLKLITIVFLIATGILSAQSDENMNTYQKIVKQTDEIYDNLVKIRRDLHMNPEISKQEKRTSKIVAEYLKGLGLEVKINIGGNGVVGILKGGKKGRKIAWRADMDAIKTDEPDPVTFIKSKNVGIRHICGHDVHTTIGLGIATILSQQKEDLEGTVYFIFQPAEETFTGAKDMIKDGLFDIIKPDEIYGLHIGPETSGMINFKANELFAYQRTLEVKFKPSANENELENFMTNILKGYARNPLKGSPWDIINNISDPKIGITSKETIYKDYFFLDGTKLYKDQGTTFFSASFFETNIENTHSIPLEIKKQILNSKFRDSFISIRYSRAYATPINDPELTNIAKQTISSFYNEEMFKPLYGQVPYSGEDFIFYQQKVPGIFFFLGGSNTEKGINSMPHSPNFAVDEKTIKYGVQCFASLIFERTSNK